MSDLISRKALCDDLREYKVHPVPISSDESEVKGYNDGIDLAISVIAEFPSAEPERKKGKWIEQDDGWDGVYYECSCCKEAFTLLDGTPSDNLYNFCPNCGADLRGER